MPSSPSDTRSSTAASGEINPDAGAVEKGPGSLTADAHHKLQEVPTAPSTVNKATTTSEDDDDDDDHIHTAVPPELLTNPGDTCAICIDTLEEEDDIRGLTCGHAFHAGCLDPWLTSRRACCPLCKADYYTPKPRPEGEATEAERRRSGRTPQPPPSAWTGIRNNRRLMLPGRFMTQSGDGTYGYNSGADRRARRAARREAASAQADRAVDVADENSEQAAPRRWRPNISNPFRNMTIPVPGRARRGGPGPRQAAAPADPSPSQLESGTVR